MAKIPASRLRESSTGELIARRIGQALVAPVFAAIGAPFMMSEIPCPRCGRVVVVLMHRTRRLHLPQQGGLLGPPLGTGHRDLVRIECDGCKTRFSDTSGSGVARAIRDDLPPLVLGCAYWALAIRVGQDCPGFSAGLADVDPARPERKKAVNLLIAVRGAAGEVKMQCHLDHHREQPSPCVPAQNIRRSVLSKRRDRPMPVAIQIWLICVRHEAHCYIARIAGMDWRRCLWI